MKGFRCCACDVGVGGTAAVVAVVGCGSGVAATEAEGWATQLVSIIEGSVRVADSAAARREDRDRRRIQGDVVAVELIWGQPVAATS